MASFQTLQHLYDDVREIVGKDSNTLLDASLLRSANKYYLQFVREIIGLNEDVYAEISSADLVSGQREYVLPIDDTASTYGGGLIKLTRVEVSYDNTNWYQAMPISMNEIVGPTITDANLATQFSKGAPVYWFKDRSIFLAPVPGSGDSVAASNAGLRLYWIKRPNELTSGSSVPEIPKDFLGFLSEGILHDVFRSLGRMDDAKDALKNWYGGIARMRELEAGINAAQPLKMKAMVKSYN